MGTVSNQGHITEIGATTQLVDQTSKMHTGILKALESYDRGNMCIGIAGFTKSAVGGFTTYILEQPIHFKARNKYQTLTTDLQVSYDSTVRDTNYTRYDWVVLDPVEFTASCTTNTSGISDGSSTSIRHITKGSGITVCIGQTVSGTGIPAGATVAAINSTTVFTLSADVNATATSTLTFGPAVEIIRGTLSGADALVSDLDASLIPIALIEITAGTADDESGYSHQLYTQNILENSLSIGYSSGGSPPYYTETASITGNSAGTTLTNTVGDFIIDNTDSNDQIVARLGTNSSATGFEVRNNSDQAKFSVSGAGIVNIDSATASRPLVVDSNKNIVSSTASNTELAYLVGVTGAVQTALDAKALKVSNTFTDKQSVVIDKDGTIVGAEDLAALKIDIDRATQNSGTAAHNDIGINVDVDSSSKGTSSAIGIDIDVVGSGTGTQTVKGLTVDVSGGDTNYAALFNGANVGIGTSTPAAPLHIVTSSTDDTLRLESTDGATALAPDLVFKRTTATPVNGDLIGNIRFLSMNSDTDDGGGTEAEHEFADIYARVNDITTNSESGELYFRTFVNGTQQNRIDLQKNQTVINEDGVNIDFRVEGNSDQELIVADAGEDKVGIGITPTTAHTSKLSLEGSMMIKERPAATADLATYGQLWVKEVAPNQLYFTNDAGNDIRLDEEVFIISLSDETTNLTTGDGKAYFNMPFAMTLTAVKATVNTAPAGSTIIVDIEEAGSTILTTLLSIDAGEKTSSTAATAAVIGGAGPALADDAEIKFNIDQIGSSTAGKGLKVTLYGYRT